MLLGKRSRPPVMRRTTSMSGGMALDNNTNNNSEPHEAEAEVEDAIKAPPHVAATGPDHGLVSEQYQTKDVLLGMVMSPHPTTATTNINHTQNQTCNPPQIIHTPPFLRTCGLCKCHLAPGRDIYMYMGDTFCSFECREKQIKQDQKEKWKWKMVASNKEEHRASPPATAASKASTKSETAACI